MIRRIWLLVAVAALAGCSRCSKGTGAAAGDAARYLPKDAVVSVVVPKLGEFGQKLTILQRLNVSNLAASMQGAQSGEEYVSAVVRQVGVDLRDKQSLENAGIDAGRALGIAVLLGGSGYAVVPVKDIGKLRETLKGMAQNRLGAGHHRKDGELELFATDASAPAQLGFIHRGDVALVAAQPLLTELRSYANLPAERALSEDATFKAAVKRLPQNADALIYSPNASQLNANLPTRATVALQLSEEALVATIDLPRAKDAPGQKALTRVDGAPDLRGRLPPDAFVVARYQGDPADLQGVWQRLAGEQLQRAVAESGFDMKGEVLDNLKPGGVLALVVAQNLKLGAGMPSLDIRRTNPFQFVNLVVLTEVKDAAKAKATLEKLPNVSERFGAKIERTMKADQPVYVTRYTAGEGIHFAPKGDYVLLASPMDRLETMLASLDQPAAAEASKFPTLDDRAFSAVLDLPQLAESIRSLPSSAWGLGGFAIKATTLKWLEAIGDLHAVTVGVQQKEDAVQAELALRFEKKQ